MKQNYGWLGCLEKSRQNDLQIGVIDFERYHMTHRFTFRLGCFLLAALPLGYVVYIITINTAAYFVARNECVKLRQVVIVDQTLWKKSILAYGSKSQANRYDWAFETVQSEWKSDFYLEPLKRSKTPVYVQGKLVAYIRDVGFFSYVPLVSRIAGARGGADFQCYFHGVHSPEIEIIAQFNK
jgi:hypothetical protein